MGATADRDGLRRKRHAIDAGSWSGGIVMTTNYSSLDRDELERRLHLAERVCLMYGWSPAHMENVREKATHEMWCEWAEVAGGEFRRPKARPELNEGLFQTLAAVRDATRAETLRRIAGEP
jgi:hypothetical protein